MSPERVDHLRPLTHEHVTRPEDHRPSLLAFRLGLHEAHRRTARRFCDGFGIGRVVFLPLDERLHIRRRHEPHVMSERTDRPGPKVGCRARFQRNDAPWQLRQECRYLSARQLLAERYASVCPSAVKLKNPLCKIKANNGNSVHGCLLLPVTLNNNITLAHLAMPSGAGIHPISSQ
ncbi:hypothetical protein SXCC_00189 [Gluconacetobacter sp. SXCC-1]|nr:hypothetical protein SXCC_00189 [Gluconacetobacter sp. SXCC-1]